MKKDGIQTRNRKMTTKTRRTTTTSLSRHGVDTMSSRRLFSLRASTPFYDRPSYYHNSAPATVFQVQPVPHTGFYPPLTSGPQGYSEFGDCYQMATGEVGIGYSTGGGEDAIPGRQPAYSYLSTVASSQQYLSAAAAGFHRHLHDLI